MTLQEVVPYLSLLLALLGFWLGRMSASKSEGERDGTLMTEVGYIKSSTDDIKKQLREQEQKYTGTDCSDECSRTKRKAGALSD